MRRIYIVNATQVVASEAHPEGVFSVVQGFPKTFDSRNYNATATNPDGDAEKVLRVAKAAYLTQLSAFYTADTRAAWAITLERSDGKQFMQESYGAFPDVTPTPEPEPEPEPET